MSKKKEPWMRLPGEGMQAYTLFMMYVEMGEHRSRDAVIAKSGRSSLVVTTLCADNRWVARAKAYDDWLVQVQTNAIEKQARNDAIEWAKRRSIYRNREYGIADKLLAKAEEMIANPLYLTTVNRIENVNGQEVAVAVTMTPAKWTLRDIPLFVKTAAEVMRLSLEMETSRSLLKVDLDNPQARLDLAKAALAEMKERIPSLVDRMMEADPNLNREELLVEVEQQLPGWMGEDWKVDRALLEEEEPALLHGVIPETDHVS